MNTTSDTYDLKKDHILKKPYLNSIAFAVGILLFLMPFAEFKCGSVAMLGNTGIGIAAGRPWKVSTGYGMNEITEKLQETAKDGKNVMKDGPNIFAIVSLAAAIFGLAVSFSKARWRSTVAMCAAILAAAMLLAVMIQFRIQLRGLMKEGGKGEMGMDIQGMLRMEFTIWYYLSLIFFIVAAFLNYMLDKLALREEIDHSMDFEFQKKE
ncbi:MAG TPA: hypothetical protein VMZ03_06130 [Chitinophagaceae bacterium]|nr:hypothetical protein [Chitinophagaceae bacterium]